ncbi:emerin-like [Lepisosteus oculatus]|uniref:Emerin n=1 Tax=Lepisosteus oculatus TaxID=7918 RepID=W5NEN3_LEPOC
MTKLSSKSDQEIIDLLDQYGLKHGPIVDSTRGLYEKKLEDVMAKDKVKTSSDKTFYREEREEITYVHYRPPIRNEEFGDGPKKYTSSEIIREPESDFSSTPKAYYKTEATYRNVSYSKPSPPKPSAAQVTGSVKEKTSQETRLIPIWFQILAFLVVAGFLYYTFSIMETPQENPFNKQDE